MSTKFFINISEYDCKCFTITVQFANHLQFKFSTDLNNIMLSDVKAFTKDFHNGVECSLDFINSKKNCVTIGYEPKSKEISFYTWNEGYIFRDIEDNSNIVDIKFIINNEEHTNFYHILQDLIDNQEDEDEDEE